MAVSGNPGENVSVVDDFLLSHEQQVIPTPSLDENRIEFEFQTDRNSYVNLRQTFLALELKLVYSCRYDTYNKKKV